MYTIGVNLGKRHRPWAVIDKSGKVLVERKVRNCREIVHRGEPGDARRASTPTGGWIGLFWAQLLFLELWDMELP